MLRDHFPIFEAKCFLNSCSKGALSREVEAAYRAYLDDWRTLGSPWEVWVDKLEATRVAFARLINAEPDEVALTTSVSAAVSALASAVDFGGERRRVLLSDFEFPGVAQVWHAQAARGAEVVHVPARCTPEGAEEIPLAHWRDRLDERTRLVSLAHVCYRNGARQDAAGVTELAHERGALVLLDAYQSLGTRPIDVKELGVDVLVGGALKYLLGPSGLAFMYVRRELIDRLEPSSTGWFAQADPMALDIHAHTPAPSARRFESGTPAVPNLYAGLAGLELLQSVGIAAIHEHLEALTGALTAGARERGWRLATPDAHGAMIALRATGAADVEELVARLAAEEIVVSSRDGNLRVSPHFYNTHDDIARLLAALERHRELLEPAPGRPERAPAAGS